MKHLARLGAIAAVGFGLIGQGVVKADLIPSLTALPTQVVGGTFNGDWAWTYLVNLNGSSLVPGSSVTLVDFNGLDVAHFGIIYPGVTGTTTPLGWALSNTSVTTQPSGVSVFDNPSIPNVQLTFNGGLGVIVPQGSFTFTAYSLPPYGASVLSPFFYNDDSIPKTGQGGVLVAAIPEPSQMALAGVAGLFAVGGLVSRFRKSA